MPPGPHQPFADFDPSIRASDLAGLHALAAGPISESSLTTWAGDSLSRHSLRGEVAWCSIRWPTSLGQPRTATFAAGFVVVHEVEVEVGVAEGGGIVTHTEVRQVTNGAPLLFPGRQDGNDFVVAMLVHPVFFWPNRLRVTLASVPWVQSGIDLGPRGYRVVEPPEQRFSYLREYGPPVVLNDFVVTRRETRLIG